MKTMMEEVQAILVSVASKLSVGIVVLEESENALALRVLLNQMHEGVDESVHFPVRLVRGPEHDGFCEEDIVELIEDGLFEHHHRSIKALFNSAVARRKEFTDFSERPLSLR